MAGIRYKAGAHQSSLPKHLIPQIDDFMETLDPFDRVFVNGDMVFMHIFVKDGNLSGIIDWGDAVLRIAIMKLLSCVYLYFRVIRFYLKHYLMQLIGQLLKVLLNNTWNGFISPGSGFNTA